jgi:hypothetical protein
VEFERSFAVFDAAGRLIDWDEGFEREWSFVAAYLKPGVTYAELLHQVANAPAAQESLIKNFGLEGIQPMIRRRIEAFGKSRSTDFKFDGRIIEIEELPTRSGGIMRLAKDVTDERGAKRALTEARHHLQAASSDADGALVEIRREADGRYTFPVMGEALQRLLHFPGEWVGADPTVFLSRILKTGDESA